MPIRLSAIILLVTLLAAGFLIYREVGSDESQIDRAIEQKVKTEHNIDSFTIIDLKIKDDFARARIESVDIDPAGIILQKKDNKWEVIWGPATGTGSDDPIFQIIPKDL